MKLIIEVTEDYYKHLKDKKHNRKATISDATILDGIPYEERECYITGAQWDEFMEEHRRSHGECKTCRYRDPEDKKCDCGELERQGCSFPVSDDYFCKFYEKGGAK